MTTALYRRYRPDTFADVIGQEHVTDPLRAALRGDRATHAYLFSGPRGCGKTTSARILARCLNCVTYPTDTPCGVCPSCVDLATGGPGSLDVVEIDAASHGGVDDARDLRERAVFAPARDRFKVFIIDEAHMVTTQGFNALLKLVEEPPAHVKFVFATTEPEKVIGTIRSRTHHYPFRLVPPAVLQDYLARLCETERIAVEPGVLPLVVRAGGGSVRDSLSVLDQLMAGAQDEGISYHLASALLGYTPGTLLDDAVGAIAAGDGGALFQVVDRVIEAGRDPRRFVEDLLDRLRDLIVIAASGEDVAEGVLRALPLDELERMRPQARALGAQRLSVVADVVNSGLTEMVGATSPRLQLELLLARALLALGAFGPVQPLASVPEIADGATTPAQPVASTGRSLSGTTPPPAPERQRAPQPASRERRHEPAPGPERDAEPASRDEQPRPPAPREPEERREPRPERAVPEPPREPAPESGSVAREAQDGGPRSERRQRGVRAPGPSTADEGTEIRRRWPEVVGTLKGLSRVTGSLVEQDATPGVLAEGTFTVLMSSPGLAQTLAQRDGASLISRALFETVGVKARVTIDVGGPGGPGGGQGPADFGGPRGGRAEVSEGRRGTGPERGEGAPARPRGQAGAEVEETRPTPRDADPRPAVGWEADPEPAPEPDPWPAAPSAWDRVEELPNEPAPPEELSQPGRNRPTSPSLAPASAAAPIEDRREPAPAPEVTSEAVARALADWEGTPLPPEPAASEPEPAGPSRQGVGPAPSLAAEDTTPFAARTASHIASAGNVSAAEEADGSWHDPGPVQAESPASRSGGSLSDGPPESHASSRAPASHRPAPWEDFPAGSELRPSHVRDAQAVRDTSKAQGASGAPGVQGTSGTQGTSNAQDNVNAQDNLNAQGHSDAQGTIYGQNTSAGSVPCTPTAASTPSVGGSAHGASPRSHAPAGASGLGTSGEPAGSRLADPGDPHGPAGAAAARATGPLPPVIDLDSRRRAEAAQARVQSAPRYEPGPVPQDSEDFAAAIADSVDAAAGGMVGVPLIASMLGGVVLEQTEDRPDQAGAVR